MRHSHIPMLARWGAPFIISCALSFSAVAQYYISAVSAQDFFYHQRCFDAFNLTTNVALFESDRWLHSSCLPCHHPFYKSRRTARLDRALHVTFQLTTPHLQTEYLDIAVSLLSVNINVTIFYINIDRPLVHGTTFDEVIYEHVFSRLPCLKDTEESHAIFHVYSIDLTKDAFKDCNEVLIATSTMLDPLHKCAGSMSLSQYAYHVEVFLGRADQHGEPLLPMPHVLLTDFNGFGALAFAEMTGVSTIILADEASFYEAIGRDERQSNQRFWQYLKSIPIEAMRSLKVASTSYDLNRFRHYAHLDIRRNPGDFWDKVTAIMVIANRFNSSTLPKQRGEYPPLLHFKKPIFPPCFDCMGSVHNGSQQLEKVDPRRLDVIVVVPPDLTGAQARHLIQGLSIARQSGQSYSNHDCARGKCWNNSFDLQVKWLIDYYYSSHVYLEPNPVPNFVSIIHDKLHLLESLLQSFRKGKSRGRTILVARCDSDARAALLLRIPTLCLPPPSASFPAQPNPKNVDVFRVLQTFESRELATQLARLLWAIEKMPEEPSIPYYDDNGQRDGLPRAIAAIFAAGSLYNIYHEKYFYHPMDKQASFTVTMYNRGFLSHRHPRRLPVFYKIAYGIACCILFLTLITFGVKRFFPAAARYLRISLRNYVNPYGSYWGKVILQVWEAVTCRVPEIEQARDIITQLWNDHNKERRKQKKGNHSSSSGKANTGNSNKGNASSQKKRLGKHR